MSTGLIKAVKQAAIDAVENGQPCDWRTGIVTSVNPLKIQVTPQFILPQSVLVVPKHLTKEEITLTFGDETKTITIHKDLANGDKVALLRQKGGQSYLILDRI